MGPLSSGAARCRGNGRTCSPARPRGPPDSPAGQYDIPVVAHDCLTWRDRSLGLDKLDAKRIRCRLTDPCIGVRHPVADACLDAARLPDLRNAYHIDLVRLEHAIVERLFRPNDNCAGLGIQVDHVQGLAAGDAKPPPLANSVERNSPVLTEHPS